MRVSLPELKAVRAGGLITRYALLGEAAFVMVDLPAEGTAGTSVEEPCRKEHWGLVLRGEVLLQGRRSRVFGSGTAFHVAPGPVHRFRGGARAVIAGFQPITAPVDETPEGLRAHGMEILRRVPAPVLPPTSMRVAGIRTRVVATGQIQAEAAVMGAWLFTRTTFGPRSGYADGWCDLPHWGLVLDGDLVVHWENGEIELLGPGDVFHCPAGAAGHRIEVADVATIVDYTPITAIDDPQRRRAPRTLAARSAVSGAPVSLPANRGHPMATLDKDRAGVA